MAFRFWVNRRHGTDRQTDGCLSETSVLWPIGGRSAMRGRCCAETPVSNVCWYIGDSRTLIIQIWQINCSRYNRCICIKYQSRMQHKKTTTCDLQTRLSELLIKNFGALWWKNFSDNPNFWQSYNKMRGAQSVCQTRWKSVALFLCYEHKTIVTNRQISKIDAFPLLKCIQPYVCNQWPWSFWYWFDVNRSTLDEDMGDKRFSRFRS